MIDDNDDDDDDKMMMDICFFNCRCTKCKFTEYLYFFFLISRMN